MFYGCGSEDNGRNVTVDEEPTKSPRSLCFELCVGITNFLGV